MSARALVIGLDGADLDMVHALGASRLPVIHSLLARGASARLRSVMPPATLPNWTTFLTGLEPAHHGVFDFTTRTDFRVAFTAGTVREAPTIAARLDRAGKRCGVVGFPGTWPPERLEHGVFVSGWDSPVDFEASPDHSWPPSLHAEIVRRFGPIRYDEADELATQDEGWHEQLPAILSERIAHREALSTWLLESRQWDLFAVYFGESDTAAHHLWSLHDEASPRRPPRVSAAAQSALTRVWERLDLAVGHLLRAAGGDQVEVTLVSDHGSGGASAKVLYLNRALADAGLLRFRKPPMSTGLASIARDRGVALLPPRARQRLFRAFGRALPGLVESRNRFGALDPSATRVFSEELNYFPSLWVNQRGRDAEGIVEAAELPALREELERFAQTLTDPWTGQRIIERVIPRDELYRGPFAERAPDFVLELALDRGYTWNLMPSASAPPGTGPIRMLGEEEKLGRKGRSLAGSHRPRGLYVAAGPRVRATGEVDARIADATATLLARMGVAPPKEMSGRVLRETLRSGGAPRAVLPEAPVERAGGADLARTEARLRALGYVD